MEDHVVLGELSKSKCMIDSFILRDGTLLVVEPEQICRAVYSSELVYEQMETIVTTGYNIGASAYWEPLTGVEYLILLKDCGALELLNSQCERIDLLETGMEQDDEKKFFAFDERDNQIFINLRKNTIFAIEYQLKNKVMYFVKRDEGPRCIFEDVDTIIGMEISWNIDYMSGRDFPTISILLLNIFSQNYYFQVIRQAPKEVRKGRQPWETFISHSKLEVQFEDNRAVLRAISNVGFFIFGPRQVLFIKLPGGYEQTVKDVEFQQFQSFEGCYMSYDLTEDDKINLDGGIILRRNVNSLEFAAFNSQNRLLKIWLKVIFEDPDELIYHWDALSTEIITIEGLTSDRQIITRTILLSNAMAILLCEPENEIIFLDLNQIQVVKRVPYNLSKMFSSDIIGTDFHKLVNCGGSVNNKGFVESKFWGHSNFFSLVESFDSEYQVMQLWNNNKGVWWKDSRGQIFCNGELIDTCMSPIHVTLDGTIVKDTSIITWSNIFNDPSGNYAYVSKVGHIGWSDETETVLLDKLRSSSLVKYILTCTKLENGSKITVLSVDNKLTILQDTHILKKDIDVSTELDSIACMNVISWRGSLRLLITDIDGKLCELDIKNVKICTKHKIGAQRAEICAVTDRGFFLIYTRDDLLLLSSTETGKFELTRIDMKTRISKIAAKDGSAISILDDDSKIHQYTIANEIPQPNVINKRIDSNLYIHTKFISLSCSTRYVLTSSLRSAYSDLLQRVKCYTEIQLHDLETQKTVSQYDLSEKYPQALVSDIVALPFNRESFMSDGMNQNNIYAMQLAFDRVFIVSLNYEMAEDESLDNLLLFSIDDNNGTIELLQGVNTSHPITALLNYHNRTLITAGEVLQAYKIDYLLKENTFKIDLVSNDVRCGGLVNTIVRLPRTYPPGMVPEGKKRKLQEGSFVNERLLILNILRGLREYVLTQKSNSAQENLRITPITTSEKSLFGDHPNANGLITHLSMCRMGETTWLITGDTERSIFLYRTSIDDEPSLIQLKLPGDIVSICSFSKSHESSYLIREESLIQCERKPISILFTISTSKGEYLIGILEDSKLLRKLKTTVGKKMEEQFKFIQLEDEQSDLIFTDTRISTDSSFKKSFEKSML
ncbi:hypothetical protein ZYGR_0P01230 [Zygosaccharomyces rouxii]|uniref:Cleavage/polyadenylation specificity factor A subunit N-terminal domain-containing protein n=1 Tax=Zygosaccharomyces rouxii TaxID=4956 RepID=A0A1Q3A1F4_ZYGRO|nr:hypothetical protein ZYGR_0P01230 [Zygosaccharomyces rouxii]